MVAGQSATVQLPELELLAGLPEELPAGFAEELLALVATDAAVERLGQRRVLGQCVEAKQAL